MQMNDKPEGWRIDTPENRAAMQSPSALADACREERILEARAIVCDSAHNLITDLGWSHRDPGGYCARYCHYFPGEPSCLLCD